MILGIDPGTRFAGYGVLTVQSGQLAAIDHGVIVLNDKWTLAQRLLQLEQGLDAVFRRHKIIHTVVEKVFFGKNADSAFKLGHARGVCLLQAQRHGSMVHEYAAKFVKKSVTGSGAASKDHVQLVLRAVLGIRSEAPMALDASDALALAVCHIRESESQMRIQKAMENSR